MRYKKYVILVIMCLLLGTQCVFADSVLDVYFNGHIINLKNKPFKEDGVVYVPIREVLVKNGMDVTWNKLNKDIKAKDRDVVLTFKNKSNTVKVNKTNFILSKPIKVIKGVSYMPLDVFTKCLNYGVIEENDSINIYSYFDIVDVIQEGVFTTKSLSSQDLSKLNKVVREIEQKYNRKVQEDMTTEFNFIDDFYRYINEPFSKEDLLGVNLGIDDYLGINVNDKDISRYSKWKLLAPLSDIESRFNRLVSYKVIDGVYLVVGYEDYSGSEKNLNKATQNYLSSYKRLYDETLSKNAEKVIKNELKGLVSIIDENKDLRVFLIKDEKIDKIY